MGFDYKNFKKTRSGENNKPAWAGWKWVKFGVATVCYLAFLYWGGVLVGTNCAAFHL